MGRGGRIRDGDGGLDEGEDSVAGEGGVDGFGEEDECASLGSPRSEHDGFLDEGCFAFERELYRGRLDLLAIHLRNEEEYQKSDVGPRVRSIYENEGVINPADKAPEIGPRRVLLKEVSQGIAAIRSVLLTNDVK